MLESSLCDYSDACILVNGTITITGNAGSPTGRTEAQILTKRQKDGRNKRVVFKNCASFIDCISVIICLTSCNHPVIMVCFQMILKWLIKKVFFHQS